MEPCPTVSLEAGYVGDYWRNASGGIQTGHAYLDKLDLLGTVDGGRAFGLEGLTLHGHVQYTKRTRIQRSFPPATAQGRQQYRGRANLATLRAVGGNGFRSDVFDERQAGTL